MKDIEKEERSISYANLTPTLMESILNGKQEEGFTVPDLGNL